MIGGCGGVRSNGHMIRMIKCDDQGIITAFKLYKCNMQIEEVLIHGFISINLSNQSENISNC